MSTVTIRHFCPCEGVIVVLRDPLTVGTRDATGDAVAAWSRGTVLALTELWAERDGRHRLWALCLSGLRTYDLAGLRIHAPSEEAAIAAALEEMGGAPGKVPEGWVCLPLTRCGGFGGPCDEVDGVERAGVRTAYVDREQPNPMLCPECREGWHEYWNELWSEVAGW